MPTHRSRTVVPALAVAMSLVLVACAGAPSPPGSSEPAPSFLATGPRISENDISPLTEYAEQHRDEFAGLYMHPPGSGSFVMLFTGHLEEHAAALAAIASNVRVQRAQFTEDELLEILDSLIRSLADMPGVEPVGGGVDTLNNKVTVDVKSNDPTLELRTELQYGGRVDVTVYPIPGPWANASSGEGWRLLAALEGSGADAYTVHAATDAAAWNEVWEGLGLPGDPPAVDFDAEVAVAFLHGIGSSCPELRLDAVAISGAEVLSVVSDPLAPRTCTADLVASVAFAVALERAALPDDGFTLWLSNDARTFSEPLKVRLP